MISVGITLVLFQSLNIFTICAGSLRSVCLDEEKSVIIPYISDRHGKFISDFNNFSIDNQIYISFKWKDGINVLQLEKTVVSPPTASLVWQDDNLTLATNIKDSHSYQGMVVGIKGSIAAITVSDEMNGYILTNKYELVIESLNDDFHSTGLHMLTACRVSDDTKKILGMKGDIKRRNRRAAEPKKYLEVLLAIDHSVQTFIGKTKLEKYIMTIMNIVNKIYKDDTLDSNIEVVTNEIIMMDKSDGDVVFVKNNARVTVDRFCAWISSHPQHARGNKHDVSVLLTRNAIGPAGYAPITGMCNPGRSCAVIKDEGFTSAFIIAHEIAHVIGVYHDGHGNDCHGREFQYSMMASMVQSTLQHYWWSRCSNQRINQVLPFLTCLNNDPYKEPLNGVTDPLGKPFSLDNQCRYEFGGNHVSCRSYYGDLCDTLWCADSSNLRLCKTKRGRPLNGTPCSSNNYWCMEGKCVYHGHQKPRHGGWGSWSPWSACSSDCDIGIKHRRRQCDNPRPAYGGKSCTGDGKEVYTCKTGDECNDYTDYRALQCSVLNGIPIDGRSHTWFPHQNEKEKDQCTLVCRSNDTGRVKKFADMPLEDGTPCSYEIPNNICVKGECWKVGCDGQLNSTEEYDSCGVCGGNGSDCKLVKGTYNRKFDYKQWPPYYERILVLPANSRGINIIENKATSHFLAIRDPRYGVYYLNGHKRATHSKKLVMNGAWFEYKNNYNRETLESSGPLRKPLELMIMPQNKYQAAIVSYEYIVRKDDFTFEKSKYEWVYDHWTDCSVTCGSGTQKIVNKCIDKDARETVDDDKCDFVAGSKHGEQTKCDRQACMQVYNWAMELEWTECSVTCGEGIQTQTYRCEEKTLSGEYTTVDTSFCDSNTKPNFTQPCNEQVCGSYIWDSSDEWTECSITCGFEALQFEKFHCALMLDSGEKQLVDDNFCEENPRPNITRPCRLEPCYQIWYQWGFNKEWTECSASCGLEGVQFPIFFCEQVDSHGFSDIVRLDMCDKHIQPENVSRPCNVESCISEWFEWSYEDWGDCTVPCGNLGHQIRDYLCERVYSNGTRVPDEIHMCDDLESPEYTQDCSGPPCKYSTFQLSYTSEWEECTASCGDMGIQTQKAVCQEVMPNGTIAAVSIYMCDDLVSIGEVQPCNRVPCTTYKWTPAPFWTNCTAECGDAGLIYQMHYCDKVLSDGSSQFVNFDLCAQIPMPFVTKNCNRIPCVVKWKTEQWSKCSVTCSKGTQTRNVYCSDPDLTDCPGDKPSDTMTCKMGDCPLEDDACNDRFKFCGRTASKRRCAYRGYRGRCCDSCSVFL